MAGGKIEFNTSLLQAGSESSRFAGTAAQKAAGRLSEAAPEQGIFGDFGAARGFHGAVKGALETHALRSQEHHSRLTVIAAKGDLGAKALSDTDADEAHAVCSAGEQFGNSRA